MALVAVSKYDALTHLIDNQRPLTIRENVLGSQSTLCGEKPPSDLHWPSPGLNSKPCPTCQRLARDVPNDHI